MSTHPGSIWLDQNWPMRTFEVWIAADQMGIVSENESFQGVINDLQRKGISLDDVTIAKGYPLGDPVQ